MGRKIFLNWDREFTVTMEAFHFPYLGLGFQTLYHME